MSGLAEILLKENFTISGSDSKASALTEHLASMGASVFYPQKASNIIDGIDVVVYTAAIHEDNEEFAEAKRQNLPMLSRAELLGQLMTITRLRLLFPVLTERQRQPLCSLTYCWQVKKTRQSLSAVF